ncbi:MAG TPA: hypothetical protein VFV46_00595 [Lacibacter sp.]|nr:hypothetical protein [Lacibacter sp.]
MQTELIKGQFSGNDALEILSEMIQVKIRYHERKIEASSNEEDIKYRESKLKNLQAELALLRKKLTQSNQPVTISTIINLTTNEEQFETAALSHS